MSFGKKETVRYVETPTPPTPPPPPPAPPTQANAAADIERSAPPGASRAQDSSGNIGSGAPGGTSGYSSLINTSTTGLSRKADTRKKTLIGGA